MSDARELLQACSVALWDWQHTYAEDMSSEDEILTAANRISEHGGTLAYIARLRATIDAYLAQADAPAPAEAPPSQKLRDAGFDRRPPPYACDECGRQFLSVAVLQAHECAA